MALLDPGIRGMSAYHCGSTAKPVLRRILKASLTICSYNLIHSSSFASLNADLIMEQEVSFSNAPIT